MRRGNLVHAARVLVAAGMIAACRVQPPENYWIETHGEMRLSRITASPQGAIGVGRDGDLYVYPGSFAVPWRRLFESSARAAGASASRTYLIAEDGGISVANARGTTKAWDHSHSWHAEAIAVDEGDNVFVIAERRAHVVSGKELQALPCDEGSVAVGAAKGVAYVISSDGGLFKANKEVCEPVATPGRVSSVAAFGRRVAIVVEGSVYDQAAAGSWRLLPRPVRYRFDGDLRVSVAEVAVSANSIWARDADGFVYVLSEMS